MNDNATSGSATELLQRFLTILLLSLLLIGSVAQLHVGLADNGDFSRLSPWLTSMPEGYTENWPAEASTQYHERFYNNVIAFWKLDMPLTSRWVSSILLVWLPGALLNTLLFSTDTLYLPLLSFAPRVILLLFVWLVLRWLRRETASAAALYSVLLGVPLVFFGFNTDYVAYFTSMYQEPASLIGVILVVLTLARFAGRGDSPWRPWIAGAALLFLTGAKISNVHWAFVGALVLIPWSALLRKPRRLALYLMLVLILPAALPIAQASLYGTRKVNAYQSIFCGTLLFSDAPWQHLSRHDMRPATKYIGHHAYGVEGRECLDLYSDKLSHAAVAEMIAHEPVIAWRMLLFAADSMQQAELTHLSKHVLYNTPGAAKHWSRWLPATAAIDTPLNAWTRLKLAVFPTGATLLAVFALALLLFAAGLRSRDRVLLTIALVGVLLALAAPLDMWMQIFGDGQRDLIKHLYLANICFDGIAILLPAYVLRVLQLLFSGGRSGYWMEDWKRLS
ncbi:MAG: hypothetical protein M5R41_17890 [Bacteroidia bacterium]|nr:hypothetical protein [Bacteroidia bacterium]